MRIFVSCILFLILGVSEGVFWYLGSKKKLPVPERRWARTVTPADFRYWGIFRVVVMLLICYGVSREDNWRINGARIMVVVLGIADIEICRRVAKAGVRPRLFHSLAAAYAVCTMLFVWVNYHQEIVRLFT